VFGGQPPEDAIHLAGVEPDVLPADFMAVRTADLAAIGGFDQRMGTCADLDFSLRLRAASGGSFAVAIESHASLLGRPGAASRVEDADRAAFIARWKGRLPPARPELWSRGGFRVEGAAGDGHLVPRPRPLVVRELGAPRRWGILNPASATEVGDKWGDTAFVAGLARALREAGEDAVTYRRPAHASRVRAMDNVSLTVRGLLPGSPTPGGVNVLWVISRPDQVSVAELSAFDLVYAASRPWARKMSARSGVEVRVLEQATRVDAAAVADSKPAAPAAGGVVFVGQARPDGPRAIVMDAITAGLEPQVWGPRWGGLIPDRLWRGEFASSDQVAQMYRSARVVLADHWEDMAREGFISNRLFDAVALGARVISDQVAGTTDLFEGAVQTYGAPADLRRLASPDGLAESFPDTATMAQIAARIRANHSFAARARQLVADVSALR
jgi:hypothetical protein